MTAARCTAPLRIQTLREFCLTWLTVWLHNTPSISFVFDEVPAALLLLFFYAHWYFIPRGLEINKV